MRRRNQVPGRIFINHGRYWWRVKLPGEATKKARPLIPPGSGFATADPGVAEDVARDMYARAVFEHGQTDVQRQPRRESRPQVRTVAGLVREYLAHARRYYVSPDGEQSGEADRIEIALRPLIEHCPALPVERFGPLAPKEYRDRMIEANLCRSYVNKRVNMVRRMFRWAVEEELVPPSVFHGLQAVMGLRRGRSGAREGEPVRPIAEAWVRRTMEFMQPTVAAMVELQMLTGMRPGELCILRPMDVDRRGKVWLYTPADHKTAHHGHKRTVPIGPRGQDVLRPFLNRPLEDYCFAPDEAEAQRHAVMRANRKTRVQPSQQNRRKPNPEKFPGDRYDTDSYRRSIEYATAAANRAVAKAAKVEGREVKENDLIPHWHPHQLRHAAATVGDGPEVFCRKSGRRVRQRVCRRADKDPRRKVLARSGRPVPGPPEGERRQAPSFLPAAAVRDRGQGRAALRRRAGMLHWRQRLVAAGGPAAFGGDAEVPATLGQG